MNLVVFVRSLACVCVRTYLILKVCVGHSRTRHANSAATSHRLPGAAALTYLTNFIVPGWRSVRLSAFERAWIDVTPSEASSRKMTAWLAPLPVT